MSMMILVFLIPLCGTVLSAEGDETKQIKRGIDTGGWVGIPNPYGYGHGQPWLPEYPLKGLRFPPFDLAHGGLYGDLSYGRVPALPLKTVPVYITKHVVLEKAVPVPEPVYIEKTYPVPVEKVVPVPIEKIIHKPVPVPVPIAEAIPVSVDRAVPVPVKQPVAVPVQQPFPVPVKQAFPVPVPVPIPIPVQPPFAFYGPGPFPPAYYGKGFGPAPFHQPLPGFVPDFVHSIDHAIAHGIGHILGHDLGHGHGYGQAFAYPALQYAHEDQSGHGQGHGHNHKKRSKD